MTHAWLFTGPPGSGRSVAARAFAAALQCERPDDLGCGECSACHTVLSRSHPDVRSVVPDGLSISVAEMRAVVATAARRPVLGRWQVVVIEDADRLTEPASNALLKVVEEPPARTVFLLCAPSTHPDDVTVTIRSRCRLVTLRTPSAEAVAGVLRDAGVDPADASWAAKPRQGHVGRARRLARDPEARARRAAVLAIPASLTSLGACLEAADQLVGAAEAEAAALSADRDAGEIEALQIALGAGGTGKGATAAARGAVGAVRDLERRQKSRATRTQRDALDRALVDLAAFYRDVLLVQSGSPVQRAHPDFDEDVRRVAKAVPPTGTSAPPGRRARLPRGTRAERQTAHRGRGDDRRAAPALRAPGPGPGYPAPRLPCRDEHGLRGHVPAPGPALLRRPGRVAAAGRRSSAVSDERRARGRRGHVGAAMGQRRHRRAARARRSGYGVGPGAGRGEPQEAGRGARRRRRLIREHDLPMKVSGVDYVNDRNHTTIYFTAPHRVDFRALVRDLAATLNGRVELRQLSARDEARLTGGIGSLRPRAVLLDVPRRLRAGQRADGQGPGSAAQPAAHLRRVRPADVLPEVRAPALSGLRRRGARYRRGRRDPGRSGHGRRPQRAAEKVVVRMAADGRRSPCALASVCASRKAYEASPAAHRTDR